MESQAPVTIISTGRPAIFVREDDKIPGLAVVIYQGTESFESVLLSDIIEAGDLKPEYNWSPLRKGDRVWQERRVRGPDKRQKFFGVVTGDYHRAYGGNTGEHPPILRAFVHWDDGSESSVYPGEVNFQVDDDLKIGDLVRLRFIATPGKVVELGESMAGRRLRCKPEYLVRLSSSALTPPSPPAA